MSLVKDVFEDSKDFVFRAQVTHLLSPREWFHHYKWRKQRADRGWSNRDTWGAGDHIAKMTAEMLQHLNDNTYVDWPEWFKLNVKEEGRGAYKSLQQVIDDINTFLEFEWTTWGEDLHSEPDDSGEPFGHKWVYPDGKIATEADISNRINKWHKEYQKRYKKAQKAMMFFGRHFSSFWD